ncbi:M20/M25/M40 family metallo-hydrolase [Streptomyces physcomitrii]|uniref:M20 family metallopeptidase n=1 Tax=Streptomyces physcomitrii TaxID=2724184 RepID=A0ABX1HC67_9ACTN|nr:M20/M25/M40 family metallo-hydrolase [Streptomyces physcomitrii]NKI44865.1 M20 family metallopeptidase [Streptomyces physcomitrii]
MSRTSDLPATGLTPALLGEADRELLLRLLALRTAGPLETGGREPVDLWEAQRVYAEAAAGLGFRVVHHAAAGPGALTGEQVPLVVREAVRTVPGFLDSQPNMVLRLGPDALPPAATVMFNVHLDTVAGGGPPSFDGRRFHGRGAIDAKGPAVALLAGLRAALESVPGLGTEVGVLIQLVSGEEGGAMGVFGTKVLAEQGYLGRLNVFCEPTGCRVLPRATASMTARLRVEGRDGIDDAPGAGHNATVLLGFLAQHLATVLPPQATDGQVCVAGLHTGDLHNKVYGTGRLLLNLSYGSPASGEAMERALAEAVRTGLEEFHSRFAGQPLLALTAREAASITTLEWLKRGLPALGGEDAWAEELLLDGAGLDPWPPEEPAFTCDAIWLAERPGTSTVVFGPGDLGANQAHAEGEFADLAELDRYAAALTRLLTTFARNRLDQGN